MAEILGIDRSFDSQVFVGSSCAFGVFDGLHRGHRFLIGKALDSARESGGKSLVLTFDLDPDDIFCPEAHKKLLTNEERIAALAQSGVDAVVVLPFTRERAAQAPSDFLEEIFGDYAPSNLHIGSDFRFGAHAAGRVDDLRLWAQKRGTRIFAHELLCERGEPFSSTRIRELLAAGEVEEANELLGRRFVITAEVVRGRGEGTGFGFPTANLVIPQDRCILAPGVYAAYAKVFSGYREDAEYGSPATGPASAMIAAPAIDSASATDTVSRRIKAAVSFGVPPTYEAVAKANCEVHLLDFEGDIYGTGLSLEFVNRVRLQRKFASVEELMAAIGEDVVRVRELLDEEKA